MKKKWNIKHPGDPGMVKALSQALNVSLPIANLLVQRGITTYEEAFRFFRPSLDMLHDPFLMKDMDRASDRVVKAVSGGEKILFFGDYDVDGTTSVAMIYSFFRDVLDYPHIGYYIPDRYTEGYGISYRGIDHAVNEGVTLMIALDCGVKAWDHAQYAKEKGVDLIVCDHHLPGAALPEVYALLDPKQPGCGYPYKELSGCGVGFKLVQAVCQKMHIGREKWEPLLDLVAVSTCSDIVDITGENRVLVYFGLKQLNSSPRPGIRKMIETASLSQELTVENIVFAIGPRINAAGRLTHGGGAVELLLAEEGSPVLDARSEWLNMQNQERRELDRQTTLEALSMIGDDAYLMSRKSTVLYNPDWNKGVVGIVASRVIEKYYKPTIILTHSAGLATGSARSINGFDLHAAIEQCSHLLESFGGHMHAAGLSMKVENVAAFTDAFDQVATSMLTDDMLVPALEVDAELPLEQINPKFYGVLRQFAPFGPGNMSPLFVAKNVTDKKEWTRVLKDEHLKMVVSQAGQKAPSFSSIGFRLGYLAGEVESASSMDIVYSIFENHWNNETRLELEIRDIKTHAQ